MVHGTAVFPQHSCSQSRTEISGLGQGKNGAVFLRGHCCISLWHGAQWSSGVCAVGQVSSVSQKLQHLRESCHHNCVRNSALSDFPFFLIFESHLCC